MSQADLAHRAKIRIATLSEVENDNGNPRLSTLLAIAKAFDPPVSILELFEDDGNDPSTAALLAWWRTIHPDDRPALLRALLKQS